MKPSLSFLVDAAMQAEKGRVACMVRLSHLSKRDATCKDTEELLEKVNQHEEWIDEKIAGIFKNHPVYPWASKIRGVGHENMAKVIGLIEGFSKWYDADDPDIPEGIEVKKEEGEQILVKAIERFTLPSKLRKYAGLYPGAKRTAGEKIEFNIELRMLLFRLLTSFMRAKNRYYEFYLKYKQWLKTTKEASGCKIIPTPAGRYCLNCSEEKKVKTARFCPDCNSELIAKKEPDGVLFLGHLDNMAKRRTMQLFTDHLWAIWREAEGLPVKAPYVIEILGHSDYIDPWKMCDR